MIINRIWTSVMIHVYYHEGTFSLSQMSMPYSLCFCDTCNIQGLIIGISIPSSISLPTFPFACSHDIPSPCLVTCCNIGWISLSGRRVSSVTRMRKSHSRWTLLNLFVWHTQETSFQSPSYVMTVDAIKAASRCSDYVVTSWSKEHVTTFLIIVTWTSWHDCVTKMLGMSIMAFTQWHEPYLSSDVLVTWSGDWSSVDQWASIEVY
jgi:hypothetical protein